jgi:hypothetical protein
VGSKSKIYRQEKKCLPHDLKFMPQSPDLALPKLLITHAAKLCFVSRMVRRPVCNAMLQEYLFLWSIVIKISARIQRLRAMLTMKSEPNAAEVAVLPCFFQYPQCSSRHPRNNSVPLVSENARKKEVQGMTSIPCCPCRMFKYAHRQHP